MQGNDLKSKGKCVKWLRELTTPEGVALLKKRLYNLNHHVKSPTTLY